MARDTKYVLSYFGKKVSESRKGYLLYVKKGIDQGRRPELTGGGLVRSLGGWSMIKKLRLKGQKTISELASEYGVHANQISRWKKQLLDASPDIFTR